MKIYSIRGKVLFSGRGVFATLVVRNKLKLKCADLRNADLRNANLQDADLRNADLRYTELWN